MLMLGSCLLITLVYIHLFSRRCGLVSFLFTVGFLCSFLVLLLDKILFAFLRFLFFSFYICLSHSLFSIVSFSNIFCFLDVILWDLLILSR
jgi:hypothetical protein